MDSAVKVISESGDAGMWVAPDNAATENVSDQVGDDIRLELIETLGSINVWRVNGEVVRDTIDIDFTNAGQHYSNPEIPINEIWIDTEAMPDETPFLIEEGLVQYRLMSQGMSYDDALAIANRKEKSMREKYEGTPVGDKVDGTAAHIEQLQTLDNGMVVWLVNGDFVRQHLYINFTEGGNPEKYAFIPRGEIWIDDDVKPEERSFILAHELYEYDEMKAGKPYAEAHAEANRVEWEQRQAEPFKAFSENVLRNMAIKIEEQIMSDSAEIKAKRKLTARPMRRAVAPAEIALRKAMQSYYAGLAKRIVAAVKEAA